MKSLFTACLVASSIVALSARAEDIRVGIIGLDTSHVVAFTKVLNDKDNPDYVPGAKVVAAFKGGSPDIESSHTRVEGFTETLQKDFGVEIVPTIEELCTKVDAIMLESVDARPHLEQVKPVFEAGLPVFIDKPLACSLSLHQEARQHPAFRAAAGAYVAVTGFLVGIENLEWCAAAQHAGNSVTGAFPAAHGDFESVTHITGLGQDIAAQGQEEGKEDKYFIHCDSGQSGVVKVGYSS